MLHGEHIGQQLEIEELRHPPPELIIHRVVQILPEKTDFFQDGTAEKNRRLVKFHLTAPPAHEILTTSKFRTRHDIIGPLIPDLAHIAKDDMSIGIFKCLPQFPKRPRGIFIVRIQPANDIPLRRAKALVHSVRLSAIFFPDKSQMGKCRGNLLRSIRRGIIKHQMLEIRVVLSQHRINTALQELCLIPARRDN